MKKFDRVVYVHALRCNNILANSLASLASSFPFNPKDDEQTIIVRKISSPTMESTVEWVRELEELRQEKMLHVKVCYQGTIKVNDDGNLWYYDIMKYIQDGTFSPLATSKNKESLRKLATRYYLEQTHYFRECR